MTSLGNLLWIVVGALVYFMMREGGGCCGGGHDDSHESNKKTLTDQSQGNVKENPRGGCCG